MGLRGPAPKPTEVRKQEGNRSKRALPTNEPNYPPGLPPRPEQMSSTAGAVWDDLIQQMGGKGVLRRVDKRALWQLCEDEAIVSDAYAGLWSMVEVIKEKAQLEGKTLPGGPMIALLSMSHGRLAMSAIRDLASRVIIERREFGLTPSSRSRIEATAEGGALDSLEMKLCG